MRAYVTAAVRFLICFGIIGSSVSLFPQAAVPISSKLKHAAQDKVAAEFDAIRSAANLTPLKRVKPSVEEVQLVCTAALTGRTVHDPAWADLQTFVTTDVARPADTLKKMALSTSTVYRTHRRYSVIVEQNPSSGHGEQMYTVGIAIRPSALKEFFAPLGFDNPFAAGEWKKQVVPECRNRPN